MYVWLIAFMSRTNKVTTNRMNKVSNNSMCQFQYITHVHFYKIIVKYVDANLDAPDNAISINKCLTWL